MMQEVKENKKRAYNKGITLIALIITIIILLILAGITIAMLTGENGILTKAVDAKTKTEIAEIKERVQTDILGAQVENRSGDITKLQFVEILNDYFEDVPTAAELPEDLTTLTLTTKAEYGSHDMKISDIWNGTFGGGEIPITPDFDEDTFTLGTDAQNTDKYGWKVREYTVKTEEFTTGVWRLFYQDSNYTYLITDERVGSYKPSDYYEAYQTGADVSTVGRKLSSMIDSMFVSSNTNPNIRATAWLTDTSDSGMWSSYRNADAVFAIGSPTAELFMASYLNRSNNSISTTLGVGTYGYYRNLGSGCLRANENYGVYNTGSYGFWFLASPYEGDPERRVGRR